VVCLSASLGFLIYCEYYCVNGLRGYMMGQVVSVSHVKDVTPAG
jgi:hypothetical protein